MLVILISKSVEQKYDQRVCYDKKRPGATSMIVKIAGNHSDMAQEVRCAIWL